MSKLEKQIKNWEKMDLKLIKKYAGAYDNYSNDDRYKLYIEMVNLIGALRGEIAKK
jgi:hypothetical protein